MENRKLNLDSSLVSTNSLANQIPPTKTGFEFQSEVNRGAITLNKIRNFSFSSGSGGTLTLGGTDNGDGVMIVRDSGGTTKVTIDNTGILVTDGNITIQNSAGGTVLDSAGIVSTTSFPSAQVFSNSLNQTTNTK